MKKIVLVLLAALLVGACGFLPTPLDPTPAAEQATTQPPPTETPTALPTDTVVPATETFTPTVELPPLNPTITPPSFDASTVPPSTATGETVIPTLTATPTALPPGGATLTPTLGVLTYGTLPPAVPFNKVTFANRSKAQAYISLQQQDENGAILEYPVKTRFTVLVPIGRYVYVAWVGGKKMTGSFNLNANSQVIIVLYKDKVVVNHN